MRTVLVGIMALLLKPSISLSAELSLKENILLAYCEKVLIDNIDYIFVESSRDYPGLLKVKILYTDKIVKSIFVSLNEWQEKKKGITLPSEGPVTYRLFLTETGWNLLKSFPNSESIKPVSCSIRT